MQKKEIRTLYRKKRMALSEMEKSKLDDLLLIQFQSAPIPFIESLLSYWPIEENNEPNTHLFTEFLRFRNPEMKCCYPVADFSTGIMKAVTTDVDTTFTKKDLNIYQPDNGLVIEAAALDLVLVPLLAFDIDGFRVGYGKGFYDRYLSECREDCIRAGFSYFEPLEGIDDRDEFDVPLDLCITPQNVYVF